MTVALDLDLACGILRGGKVEVREGQAQHLPKPLGPSAVTGPGVWPAVGPGELLPGKGATAQQTRLWFTVRPCVFTAGLLLAGIVPRLGMMLVVASPGLVIPGGVVAV